MTPIDKFKNGEITKEELMTLAESDAALMEEVKALLGEPLDDDTLEEVSAAGVTVQTDRMMW